MSVKRYFPVTNGTAFMGMRCHDTPEWGNQLEFYVLATDFDALANELQATQCAEKMTADSLAEARAMLVKFVDVGQYRLNVGPFCAHISGFPARFCGRAERWPGHGAEAIAADCGHTFVDGEWIARAAIEAAKP